DASVGGHLPVPAVPGCGRHADHRSIQAQTARRTVEDGVVAEDTTVTGVGPVALRWCVRVEQALLVPRTVVEVAAGLRGAAPRGGRDRRQLGVGARARGGVGR